jgi:LPXTG-motif cell wall-anchored protein
MLLAAMLAMVLVAAAPAIAQPEVKAGKSSAKGGPAPEANASGSAIAKVTPPPPPPKAAPPPPPPKAAAPPPPPKAAPPPPKAMPKTGGVDPAPLLAVGAGSALLLGGGLLTRRIVRRAEH